MAERFSSREFNQDRGGAKRAAERGPAFITDRGRPSHVLMTYEAYQRLTSARGDTVELLGQPAGVEDVRFDPPHTRDVAQPADFD
jgi:hypothetical protein